MSSVIFDVMYLEFLARHLIKIIDTRYINAHQGTRPVCSKIHDSPATGCFQIYCLVQRPSSAGMKLHTTNLPVNNAIIPRGLAERTPGDGHPAHRPKSEGV